MKRSAADAQQPEDNFREGFSQKLKHYQAAPDRDLWNRIELTLDKQEVGVYKKRYKLFSQLAAACLLLLLSVGGYLGFRQLNQPAGQPEIAVVTSQTELNEAAQNEASQFGKSNESKILAHTSREQHPESASNSNPEERNSEKETVQENENATKLATFKAATNYGAKIAGRPTGTLASTVEGQKGSEENSPAVAAIAAHATRKNPAENKLSDHSFSGQNPTVLAAAKTGITQPSGVTRQIAAASENGTENSAKTAVAVPGNSKAREATNLNPATAPASEIAAQADKQPKMVAKSNGSSKTFSADSLAPAVVRATIAAQATLTDSLNKTAINLPEPKSLSRWSVGVSYAAQHFDQNLVLNRSALPEVSLYNNTTPQPSAIPAPVINTNNEAAIAEFNQQTSSAYSWQAGVEVGYALNPNFTLISGLRFTDNQAVTKAMYEVREMPSASLSDPDIAGESVLLAVLNTNAASPEAVAMPVSETRTYYRYHYLGLPLQLRFSTWLGENWRSYLGGGTVLNVLVGGNMGMPGGQKDEASINPTGVNKQLAASKVQPHGLNIALAASAGLQYRLSPQLQLETGAELNWYTRTMLEEGQVNGLEQNHPLTLGARAGLSYTFAR